MEERKRREFDPTVLALRECVEEAKKNPIDADAYQKMLTVLEFMEVLSGWLEEMKRLSPDTLMALFRMGARVKKALAWLSRK
jgi:DNA-binding transcriptional regulator GbsR (MarR family)